MNPEQRREQERVTPSFEARSKMLPLHADVIREEIHREVAESAIFEGETDDTVLDEE